ncbi:hypothetical protein PsorP6_007950 [Peronosclerospora sorghi]|uniref:Uncharacterized protein n=1 Tax=Peronosclerospora sorghi TaxID=230839 RepID=A0ACC0WAQ6_9STRA|nr:hypothetical protein PsorP6_007950 [Peronosclerospora sorghi]
MRIDQGFCNVLKQAEFVRGPRERRLARLQDVMEIVTFHVLGDDAASRACVPMPRQRTRQCAHGATSRGDKFLGQTRPGGTTRSTSRCAGVFDGHGAAMVRARVHESKASFRDPSRDVHVMKRKSMRHEKWIHKAKKLITGVVWSNPSSGSEAGRVARQRARPCTSNKSATRKQPGTTMYMRSRCVPDDDVGTLDDGVGTVDAGLSKTQQCIGCFVVLRRSLRTQGRE